MTDDNRRKNNEKKSTSNIWLVLLAVTGAVLLSAFLFSNSRHQLSYPDLLELLAKQDPSAGQTAKVVVKTNQGTLVEYSQPRNINVADDEITGLVRYRSLGVSGEASGKVAKNVEFVTYRTIDNQAEESRLVEALESSGVV